MVVSLHIWEEEQLPASKDLCNGYAGKNWEKEGGTSLLSAKETGHASHLPTGLLASPAIPVPWNCVLLGPVTGGL